MREYIGRLRVLEDLYLQARAIWQLEIDDTFPKGTVVLIRKPRCPKLINVRAIVCSRCNCEGELRLRIKQRNGKSKFVSIHYYFLFKEEMSRG